MKKPKKTLTRANLYEAVYKKVGLSRIDSAKLAESVLNTIGNTIMQGEKVKISSFGTFETRNKKQRVGRNPKTGEEVAITPRKVLSFRPSNILKQNINKRHLKRAKKNEK